MPIFDYKCERCGFKVSKWMTYVSSKKPVYCTNYSDNMFKTCNGRMVKDSYASNIPLAGGGWTMTGFSNKQIRGNIIK